MSSIVERQDFWELALARGHAHVTEIKSFQDNWSTHRKDEYAEVTLGVFGPDSTNRQCVTLRNNGKQWGIGGGWTSYKTIVAATGLPVAFLDGIQSGLTAACELSKHFLQTMEQLREDYFLQQEAEKKKYKLNRHSFINHVREATPGVDYRKRPQALRSLALKEYDDSSQTIGFVYFLCSEANEVLYVGQTINLCNRIREHRKNKEFSRVYYIECDALSLDDTEAGLITKLDPPLNKTKPRPSR